MSIKVLYLPKTFNIPKTNFWLRPSPLPDYIFGQFRKTARCRDAQHGDGDCCDFLNFVFIVLVNKDE